jgi:HEAT repeat protein
MKSERARVWWQSPLLAGALALSLLRVAAAGAAPGAPPLSDAGPILDDLGKQVQDRNRSEAERLQTIDLLRQWATEQVRAPLIAVLGDPLASIRAAAAQALGWPGNGGAVAALRERVEAAGEVVAVRAAALGALGRIGDDSARPLLLSATRDPDPEVREPVLWALTFGGLVSQTDRIPLLRQLAGDAAVDLRMRCQAIQGLGAVKDSGAADLLIRLLEHEPLYPMPKLSDAPTQPETMLVRYREARDVRAWAANALGLIGARAALPLLLKAAEEPDDFFLRTMSVETLGSWKAPEALPVFLRSLEDPFAYARLAALSALANLGDKSVVDQVLARLADKLTVVRIEAVNTLAELGDARARPQLEALQERDTDVNLQAAIAKALARLSR